MPNQPQDRKPPAKPEFVTLKVAEFEALQERWRDNQRNQITVMNRLLGIIDLARETASSPSLSPDEKVQKIKEILK